MVQAPAGGVCEAIRRARGGEVVLPPKTGRRPDGRACEGQPVPGVCGLVDSGPKDGTEEQKARVIYELAEGIESDCGLYVRCTEPGEIPALISTCGTLITSRVPELVRYTCIADLAHTAVVSGVDVPIF